MGSCVDYAIRIHPSALVLRSCLSSVFLPRSRSRPLYSPLSGLATLIIREYGYFVERKFIVFRSLFHLLAYPELQHWTEHTRGTFRAG